MKYIFLLLLIFSNSSVFAACLDGLSAADTVSSKVRGFYINADKDNVNQFQYVILDKASCTASQSGGVTLQQYTKNNYYLQFNSNDKTLYTSLLSAEARGVIVQFRLDRAITTGGYNGIAYIVTPSNARSQ